MGAKRNRASWYRGLKGEEARRTGRLLGDATGHGNVRDEEAQIPFQKGILFVVGARINRVKGDRGGNRRASKTGSAQNFPSTVLSNDRKMMTLEGGVRDIGVAVFEPCLTTGRDRFTKKGRNP